MTDKTITEPIEYVNGTRSVPTSKIIDLTTQSRLMSIFLYGVLPAMGAILVIAIIWIICKSRASGTVKTGAHV